jgi:hypothetical protein
MSDATFSEKIEAKETPLSNLFSENFMFNIPVYQRPFSWTADNFDALFDDIANAMQNNMAQYFLGSVLLQQTSKNVYSVVDGQQRLTALTILLAVIRDATKNDRLKESITSYLYQKDDPFKDIPEVMRVTPWIELKDLFKEYVYKTGGTLEYFSRIIEPKKYKDEDDPRYHLWEAIDTFNDKLDGFTEVESFVKYLLTRVYIVYIKTNSQASAFRLFSVMNARGLPLGPSDLLKSENLEAIADDAKRDRYAQIWRDIEEEIGREEFGSVIAFIRTIKMKEKAELGIYEEFQNIFRSGLLTRGTQFIDYLKEISDIYGEKIIDKELKTKNVSDNNDYRVSIDNMQRFVPFSEWIPPLLAFHQKFKSDEALIKFLRKLEKRVVIDWTMGFSGTERMTRLNKIIRLVDETKSLDEALGSIDPASNEELESLSVQINHPRIYSIYQGKLAKYLLLRIDKESWEIENFSGYPGLVTVEHILPQNPPSDSKWLASFNKEQREEWTSALGNLVLLSGRKNSKAQNYDFDKKKQIYNGQKGSGFKITQKMDDYADWTPEALKKRHQDLAWTAMQVFTG